MNHINEPVQATETQFNELRGMFEPMYGRALTTEELREIHLNLSNFASAAFRGASNF